MKSLFPSKTKWILEGVFVFTLLSCSLLVAAESATPDIWTEDTGPFTEEAWSDRRVEGFLNRLEEMDPKRADELRTLWEKDPDQFRKTIREEWQKMRPPMERPDGPQGPGRRDSMRGPEGGGRGRWMEHMQKRHEEFIEWLEKNDPELAQELARIQENDPQAYFNRTMEARRKYDPILKAEKNNPELAGVLKEDLAMQKQRDEILEELRGAEGEKREQLILELKALTSQRFDLIIRKKTLQYKALERRLKKLQEQLEKRQNEVQKLKNGKDQALDERMKELMARVEKVEWN